MFRAIKDFFYGISVKFASRRKKQTKIKDIKSEKIKDAIFCIVLLIIPTVQFIVFYLGVHFNSILLSVRDYDVIKGEYNFVGLKNIISVFKSFTTEVVMIKSIRNSFVLYGIDLVVGVSLTILFSYAVYKKVFGYGFMRVVLFLPSIISPIVMVLIFRNFVGAAIPNMIQRVVGGEEPLGLLSNPDTQFETLVFYTIWISFGTKVLLYSGAMSGINESVIEAAKIDGANNFQELIRIVLPLIFPTFSTFLVTSVAGIFTNQMALFSFYGTKPISYDLYTIGYYLYRSASELDGLAGYSELAALGVCISIFTIPVTFAVRKLLDKYGPSVG